MTTLYRLVTVGEARAELSILDNEDDERINYLIVDASQIIMDYLKKNNAYLGGWCDTSGLPLVDSNGNPQRVGAVGSLDTGGNFVLALDTHGDPINPGISIIPGMVRRACFFVIVNIAEVRDGTRDPLTPGVESLLMRVRDPALA